MKAAWTVDVYQPSSQRFGGQLPVVQVLFYGATRSDALRNYHAHLAACGPLCWAVIEGRIGGEAAFATGQYRADDAPHLAPSPIGEPINPANAREREIVRLVVDSHAPGGELLLSHVFFVPNGDDATVAAWQALRKHQPGCTWLEALTMAEEQRCVRWYDGGWSS